MAGGASARLRMWVVLVAALLVALLLAVVPLPSSERTGTDPAATAAAALTDGTAGTATSPTAATPGRPGTPSRSQPTAPEVLRFAVIGDVPYTDAQRAQLGTWIEQLNADPRLAFTVHLGDIKAGAAPCSDEYYQQVRALFDRFERPLVYTPGDNEWTDCHRSSAGNHDPLERLARLRSVFFPAPGSTLGRHPMTVASEAAQGFPENVVWRAGGAAFATLHVVGSADGTQPWSPDPATVTEQLSARAARLANAQAVVTRVFAAARAGGDAAVVLFLQADLFATTEDDAEDKANGGQPYQEQAGVFGPVVQTIARESLAWDRPVLIFNGDSHRYSQAVPLVLGSPWLAAYGLSQPVPLLERVTVDGSERAAGYLRVTVDPSAFRVVSVQPVTFATPPSTGSSTGPTP